MGKHKAEDDADMTERLRQLERLLAPQLVAPRSPADDAIGDAFPPLLAVDPHMGLMYVVGHEPHFRPVTLLAPSRALREAGPGTP